MEAYNQEPIIREKSRFPLGLIVLSVVICGAIGFGVYQYGEDVYDRYFYFLSNPTTTIATLLISIYNYLRNK